jgi:hypothetical protein
MSIPSLFLLQQRKLNKLFQRHQSLRSFTLALTLGSIMVTGLPASAQLAPQVTGFTYSFTSGRGASNRTSAGTLSSANALQLVTEPGNTELIQRPDGTFAFRINDPNNKFGSALTFSTEIDRSRGSNFGITQFNDFGYSVFQ